MSRPTELEVNRTLLAEAERRIADLEYRLVQQQGLARDAVVRADGLQRRVTALEDYCGAMPNLDARQVRVTIAGEDLELGPPADGGLFVQRATCGVRWTSDGFACICDEPRGHEGDMHVCQHPVPIDHTATAPAVLPGGIVEIEVQHADGSIGGRVRLVLDPHGPPHLDLTDSRTREVLARAPILSPRIVRGDLEAVNLGEWTFWRAIGGGR